MDEEVADTEEERMRAEQLDAELTIEHENQDWEEFISCSPLPNVVTYNTISATL